ncbi:AmmeMemoRadiSam system protein B [candidate division KSB1 bacterium]|nr:AmmeMemoRadiSam system protein B [candidate division KSB1 bacterium]
MKLYYRVLITILLMTLIAPACQRQEARAERVRQPARAGQFYPGSERELAQVIDGFLAHSKQLNVEVPGPIHALWAPHAGYVFSGQVAANAYQQVRGQKYDAVLILGPAHTMYLQGASIGDWESYLTPLGKAQIHRELTDRLVAATPLIQSNNQAHLQEHSVEVQIPFIQTVLPGVPIVPMVVGNLSYPDCERLAQILYKNTKDMRVLFVASSDMSHYPSYDDAMTADAKVLNAVEAWDTKEVMRLDMASVREKTSNLDCALCGKSTLVTVMLAAQYFDASRVKMLPYQNSGDISGDKKRVVGYGAALFYEKGGEMQDENAMLEEIPFTSEEQAKLFRVARQSILAALTKEKMPDWDVKESNLKVKRGVFVTLTNKGRLRGCIGNFQPTYPLYEMVSNMAVASATQDYRFAYDPVTKSEMDEIEIKISILSELKKIDSIEEIVVGKHGIWVKQGSRSGTYLPEVATDLGWTKEQFLESCCAEKAGLAPDAWKTGADIFIYTSQILSDAK